MLIIIVLAAIGFCISLYTYIVEKKIKSVPGYKPVCDISDKISCSKPMKSAYSNIFFFSNAIIGMIFYFFIAMLVLLHADKLLLIASISSCIVSLFLAYLLYFRVKSLCLLCTSLYIINFIITILVVKTLYA